MPKSGGNSSPWKGWDQGQGELREQLPRLRLPLTLRFRLPSPLRPPTCAYFHFRGHQGRDGKEKEKRLAEAPASVASAESNQRRWSWGPRAPPLKEPSAAARAPLEVKQTGTAAVPADWGQILRVPLAGFLGFAETGRTATEA